MTCYGLDNRGSVLDKGSYFSLHHHVQTSSGTYADYYPVVTAVFSSELSDLTIKLTTHPSNTKTQCLELYLHPHVSWWYDAWVSTWSTLPLPVFMNLHLIDVLPFNPLFSNTKPDLWVQWRVWQLYPVILTLESLQVLDAWSLWGHYESLLSYGVDIKIYSESLCVILSPIDIVESYTLLVCSTSCAAVSQSDFSVSVCLWWYWKSLCMSSPSSFF
jgi:hypothetical protein